MVGTLGIPNNNMKEQGEMSFQKDADQQAILQKVWKKLFQIQLSTSLYGQSKEKAELSTTGSKPGTTDYPFCCRLHKQLPSISWSESDQSLSPENKDFVRNLQQQS